MSDQLYVERCRRSKPPVKPADMVSRMHMASIWRSCGKMISYQMARGKGKAMQAVVAADGGPAAHAREAARGSHPNDNDNLACSACMAGE